MLGRLHTLYYFSHRLGHFFTVGYLYNACILSRHAATQTNSSIKLELLKNSMRATVESHGIDADYPPSKVVIADGSDNEDVIIKVSDEGGGIPRSNMKRIWSYVSCRSHGVA